MIKDIPAKRVITCDICEDECSLSTNFKKETVLSLHRNALDMYGDPAASANVVLQLCDTCETTISGLINEQKQR